MPNVNLHVLDIYSQKIGLKTGRPTHSALTYDAELIPTVPCILLSIEADNQMTLDTTLSPGDAEGLAMLLLDAVAPLRRKAKE